MSFLTPRLSAFVLLATGLSVFAGSARAQTTRNTYTSVNPYSGTVTRTTVTRPNVAGIGAIIANQNIYGSAYPGTTTQTTVTYGNSNLYLGGAACAPPVLAAPCAPVYGQNYVYPGYPAYADYPTQTYVYPALPSTTVIAPPATNWQQPSYLTDIPLGGSVSTYSQSTGGYVYPGTTITQGTTYVYPAAPSITEISPPIRDWQVPSYVTTIPLSGSVSSTYTQTGPAYPAYPPSVVNNYYNSNRNPGNFNGTQNGTQQAAPLYAPGYAGNVYAQQRYGNNNQSNSGYGNTQQRYGNSQQQFGSTNQNYGANNGVNNAGIGYRGINAGVSTGFNNRGGNTLATSITNNIPASTFHQNQNLTDTGTVTTWSR